MGHPQTRRDARRSGGGLRILRCDERTSLQEELRSRHESLVKNAAGGTENPGRLLYFEKRQQKRIERDMERLIQSGTLRGSVVQMARQARYHVHRQRIQTDRRAERFLHGTYFLGD